MSISKKIGFYTAGLPFDGSSLSHPGGLGGSETAFIQVTRSLVKRGHEVFALNCCENPGIYEGVQYHNIKNSLPLLAKEHFDIFVVSRYAPFFSMPVSASLKVLWNHDTLDNPKDLRVVQDKIDIFLVLSNFHKNNFLSRLPQLDNQLLVTRNGLDFDLLDTSASPHKDPNKLIYASRPERGLKILLKDIWPKLHQFNPQLKLYLCGYQIKLDNMPASLKNTYDETNYLMENTPGLVLLGGLNKKEYYKHLSQAALMVYPCIFPEISCIAALEAQALGVPILTSDSYALSETVVDSQTKVGGKPGSESYINEYVERAITLLNNPEKLQQIGQDSQKVIRSHYSWDHISAEWERIFNLSLRAKNNHNCLSDEWEHIFNLSLRAKNNHNCLIETKPVESVHLH